MRGGLQIKKKIVLIVVGIILSILIVFGYPHFLKYETYSVDTTLEINDKYSYHISEIALLPFQSKNELERQKKTPWYFDVDWLSLEWRINIDRMYYFFSFPYNKNSADIVLKGEALGGRSGEMPDLIGTIIEINNTKYKLERFNMTASNGGVNYFVIIVTIDEEIESLKTVSLQIKNTKVNWDNLEQSKDIRYTFCPFRNFNEYFSNHYLFKEG